MIRCIIGLGNPGRKYAGTRHNIGFRVVDALAERERRRWRHRLLAPYDIAFGTSPDQPALCKPRTFMNASGKAVAALRRSKGYRPEELLVVYDDVHLPLGRVRLRSGGSAGGHNGMKSIIGVLGTQEFARLRLGIGHGKGDNRVNHVLGRFSRGEEMCVKEVVAAAVDAVQRLTRDDWESVVQAMNSWVASHSPDEG